MSDEAKKVKLVERWYVTDSSINRPLHWKRPRTVNVTTDLFRVGVPFKFVDRTFAIMASCSTHTFKLRIKDYRRMELYLSRVSKRGKVACARYVKTLRNYHLKEIKNYQEWFTLPSPPTPELRFIYDSACIQEAHEFKYERNVKPMGHGFSGGEYHWREWPLSNVVVSVGGAE